MNLYIYMYIDQSRIIDRNMGITIYIKKDVNKGINRNICMDINIGIYIYI